MEDIQTTFNEDENLNEDGVIENVYSKDEITE